MTSSPSVTGSAGLSRITGSTGRTKERVSGLFFYSSVKPQNNWRAALTCHRDVDGVAAAPLLRLAPVHPGVRGKGILDGAGGLTRDAPAIPAHIQRLIGGVSPHRPAAGARHTLQGDLVVPEELRSVGSDAQRGYGGAENQGFSFRASGIGGGDQSRAQRTTSVRCYFVIFPMKSVKVEQQSTF